LHASRIFHSTYGLDPNYGLTGTSLQEVETDRYLINAAAQLIVVADSSKFSQTGTIRLVPTERIHTLITDTDASKACLSKIEQQGVQVIVV
jgi:DeoR/GlpR family transcriptional regulator of sugar metabolism